MTTTPTSPHPVPVVTAYSARQILDAAEAIEQAEKEIKQRTLAAFRACDMQLVEQVLEKWLVDPPQEILAWLKQQNST